VQVKRALSILGACFLVILVAGGGMLGYAAFEGSHLDAESIAYVETTLPKLLSNPTSENFLSFVASEDRGNFNSVAVAGFASYMEANLGAFQSCDDPKGEAWMMMSPSGENITGKYLARCHFSKASVTTTVSLRKVDGAWNLVGVFFEAGTLERTDPAASKTSL
jgi:hypothetical protein